jgi:hypothetical protein
LSGGDELARLRHGVGDHAADRVIGAGRAAGSNAEELLRMRRAGDGSRGDQGAE